MYTMPLQHQQIPSAVTQVGSRKDSVYAAYHCLMPLWRKEACSPLLTKMVFDCKDVVLDPSYSSLSKAHMSQDGE